MPEDGDMTAWLLVTVMVTSTVLGDVLQTREMKKVGEVHDFRPGNLLPELARRKYLVLAVAFMAVSFFAFVKLLSIADLSFAVPASAGTVVPIFCTSAKKDKGVKELLDALSKYGLSPRMATKKLERLEHFISGRLEDRIAGKPRDPHSDGPRNVNFGRPSFHGSIGRS